MSQDATDPSPFTLTRRRLLGSAAGAAAASLMPPNVQRALAQGPPRQGSLRDIKHVVMLMQENRLFDHYFGTMAGVRGFGDPNAPTLSSGRSVFYQPDSVNPSGYLLPFHLDTRTISAQLIPSTSHAWSVQHSSWNGGKRDNWLPAHRKAEGWVCSQPFDHTSVLQFLEKFTGVAEPNISDWRRKTFGDLTAPFRFDAERAKPPQLPDTVNTLTHARFESEHLPKPTLPGAEQNPPTQEQGERKRIPPGHHS